MKFEFPEITKVSFETENVAQLIGVGDPTVENISGASTDTI